MKPAFAFATANTSNLQQRQTNRVVRTARNIFFFSKIEQELAKANASKPTQKKEQTQAVKQKPIWKNRGGWSCAETLGCMFGIGFAGACVAGFVAIGSPEAYAATVGTVVGAVVLAGVIGAIYSSRETISESVKRMWQNYDPGPSEAERLSKTGQGGKPPIGSKGDYARLSAAYRIKHPPHKPHL
ncbi:MAG: hypothetical protein WC759_00430 [Candidatus Micrarchaeia archaeon]|jgi:hypothetical protein